VHAFHGTSGDIWRISVRPSEGPDTVAKLAAQEVIYDWGGGLVWAQLPEGTDARAKLGKFGGHATLVRASQKTRQKLPGFQPEPTPIALLSQGLRDKFDPRGILNAGLMGNVAR